MGGRSHPGRSSAGRSKLRHWVGGRSGAALCAVVIGLLALSLYALTLAPGLTWAHDSADGGELAAAARTLGIAHPPGYPTYLLLAHTITRLPLGQVATRTNLLSALCGAGAAALLTWALTRMNRSLPSALSAGLMLTVSPLLWSQATVTEVHTLNGLFAALILAFVVSSERQPASSLPSLAIGLVWGLSLGNHPTAIFLIPLVFTGLWRSGKWGLGLIGAALGLTTYLYLPLRAAADPPINWGDPQTWERFWWVISGAPYRHFVLSLPLEYLPSRLLAWSGLLTRQFSVIGLTGVGLGTALLWVEERTLLGATAATVGLGSTFALAYNTSDSYLYLIPSLICMGLWLGIGLDRTISILAGRADWAGRVGAALAILLPLGLGLMRLPAQDLSGEREAQAFVDTVLQQAPADALILSQRDDHTFALWYGRYALDRREDVVVVDVGLMPQDWYTASLSRQLGTPELAALLGEGEADLQVISQSLSRPVCRLDLEGHLRCTEPGGTVQ